MQTSRFFFHRFIPVIGLFLLGILSTATSSWASDPVGIYGVVEKVTLKPTESAPTTLEIQGIFAVAEGDRGNKYSPPSRGVLFFKLPPGKEEVALKEWKDLHSLAGRTGIVAFGARHTQKVTLRKPGGSSSSPDIFPLGVGVQKIDRQNYSPIPEIKKFLEENKPDQNKPASRP